MLDIGSQCASFVVHAGDMFHIDSGSLHHIGNIGTDVCEFVIAFRNERPEDFGLKTYRDVLLTNPRGRDA